MTESPHPDRVPFSQACLSGREFEYTAEAIKNRYTSASGPFSERAAELLGDAIGASDVLLTTSCTDALEMSAMLLDLSPSDTVLVPSFTFSSTALAFVRQGANIRFCDIEPTTLGIDPSHVTELLDDSVKAVVPVHYAGVGCDMAGLSEALAHRPDVAIVEDNAHGLFGRYRDRPLGSFGRFSTLSFHETKNFTCGEGGALIVNEPEDVERAHVIYDKGTNRRQFMLRQVDKYSWQDVGSSFGMSDLLAAFLLAQLEERETTLAARKAIIDRYVENLSPHAERLGFNLPVVPQDRTSAHHMFYVLLPDQKVRDSVLLKLGEQGIKAAFHYVPLHSSEAGRRFSDRNHECPVSDQISESLLRLPLYNNLAPGLVDRVSSSFLDAVTAAA
jgi:dTDP-4-amino-4,6-dideoxygalactose transaminase